VFLFEVTKCKKGTAHPFVIVDKVRSTDWCEDSVLKSKNVLKWAKKQTDSQRYIKLDHYSFFQGDRHTDKSKNAKKANFEKNSILQLRNFQTTMSAKRKSQNFMEKIFFCGNLWSKRKTTEIPLWGQTTISQDNPSNSADILPLIVSEASKRRQHYGRRRRLKRFFFVSTSNIPIKFHLFD